MSHINNETEKFSQMLYECLRSQDCQERIDPDQLAEFKKQHIDSLYPQKQEGQRFEVCTSPGNFCCGFKEGDASFKKFGLSICLYFNFLKHSCIYLIIVSTLAILSCVVCYFVAMQNGIKTMDNYSEFLFSTTYGSFASQHNKCKYSLITNKNATYSSSFNIKCDTGKINLFGPSLSTQSLNSLYNCKNQKRKWSSNADSPSQYALNNSINCNQANSECNISMIFKSNFTKNNYKTIAYIYECQSSSYQIGYIYGKSEDYFLFILLSDFFISTFFIVFLITEVYSEKQATKQFQLQVLTSDYSIQIKGFTTQTAEKELQTLLHKLRWTTQKNIASIVTYTFQQNQDMYQLYRKRQKAYRAVSDLIEICYNYDERNNILRFRECYDNIFNQNDQKKAQRYKQYSQKLATIVNQIISVDRILMKNETQSNEKVSCFLVFQNIKAAKTFKIKTDKKCSRCCSNKLHINDKVYQLKSAPVPDLILRENCYSWTKLRVFISWIFTIVIIAGSYLIFGFIQYKQGEMNSTYNLDIDCNILYNSSQLATINSSLLSQANYVSCICKSKVLRDLYEQNSSYCSTWQFQNFIYKNIAIFISLGIVAYNILASFLFQLLSKFERHKTVINQQVSYTLKRAFQLITNMGLIVILLNFNIKNQTYLNQMSFIYLGKFDDFALHSYENISTIIILTMIFNIATPFVQFLLTVIKKGFKKCIDTRCGCVSTSKRTKDEYLEYFNDNILRLEQRYAYLIATFFITFAFCGVLPILIPILAISLVFLYCLDKILIFKFYQIPIIYTQTLHKIFINTLKISVIAHLSLTAYFLSQPSLLPENSRVTAHIVSDNTRINNMITLGWLYLYIAQLVIAFVFQILISCCDKDEAVMKQHDFLGALSKKQAVSMLKVLTYTKKRLMRKKQVTREFPLQNMPKCQNILENAIRRLKLIERWHNERGMIQRARLVGIPSYDYTIRPDKISRNAMMMKVQSKLAALCNIQPRRQIGIQLCNQTSDRICER